MEINNKQCADSAHCTSTEEWINAAAKAMKTNIATDYSQSQRLLRCGVSADTADMHIDNYGELWASPYKDNQRKGEKDFTPAWSLSRLLELLPKELNDFPFTKWYEPFQDGWDISDIEIKCTINGEVKLYFSGKTWAVDYDWDGFKGRLPQSDDPIEACVLAIELLTANGYKLNEQ